MRAITVSVLGTARLEGISGDKGNARGGRDRADISLSGDVLFGRVQVLHHERRVRVELVDVAQEGAVIELSPSGRDIVELRGQDLPHADLHSVGP